MQKKLAAFDVDGTITFTDSFMLFLRFVSGPYAFVAKLFFLTPYFAMYLLRFISRDTMKNHILSAFFKNMDHEYYLRKCTEFAQFYPQIMHEDAIAAIKYHQDCNDIVALVSASLEDYLVPFAKTMGISHILATKMEIIDGKLNGKMHGSNCRAQEKLNRIRAEFGDIEIIAAYGDSRGDKEMIEAATNKFYRTLHKAPSNYKQITREFYWGNRFKA